MQPVKPSDSSSKVAKSGFIVASIRQCQVGQLKGTGIVAGTQCVARFADAGDQSAADDHRLVRRHGSVKLMRFGHFQRLLRLSGAAGEQ